MEVLRQATGLVEVGPRKPRTIIYDVETDLGEDDIAECLTTQNPELGLSTAEAESIKSLHKLGKKGGYSTHWVIEANPSAFSKIENRKVFLGISRCSVKLHKSTNQCYKCQKYGHTALKCKSKIPTCRVCAEKHDSRGCT